MITSMLLGDNMCLRTGGERATGRPTAPAGQFDGLVRSML